MSTMWPNLESNSEKSILDRLCLPDHDIAYDSDVSVNDNISNASSVPNNSIKPTCSSITSDSKSKTAAPLFPERIRWFYKENKLWIPFGGYDSLRLETKYRELSNQSTISPDSIKEKIVVRGDLYEVDVLNRIGFPIYWNAVDDGQESFPIIRGTWFREASWQPLDSEKISNKIEKEHLKLYGDTNSTETTDGFAQQISQKLHLNVKSLVISGYHIDWYGEDSVFIYTDSASHFIRHKLGLTKVGSKLHRGYKNEARIEDKLPEITHLVFVIHGIGQKMKGGDITYQVSRIRAVCRKVTKKFFPLLEAANQRVEFLPVEWRKSLVLDGNTVDLITPTRNKGLRNVVNSTALDILYYSSPIFRPEMIGSLRSELNRLYSMFCARSPYFENKGGKVSALAHSLGAVLLYDILTNWSPAKIYEYLETLEINNKDKFNHENRMQLFSDLNIAKEKVHHLELLVLTKAEQENTNRGQANFRKANFPSNFINGTLWRVLPKLENLFCVGSPLAVFLALRGLKPQNVSTIEHILPEDLCRRVFNIFHPADPVVYRLEPLINQMYANIEPLRIYPLDHPNKVPYDSIVFDPNSDQDNLVTKEILSERPVNTDHSQRSTSEATSYSLPKSNYTLAGKLIKFFHKVKHATHSKLTNSVVNQIASNQEEINLLDGNSENTLITIKKRKKRIKTNVFCRNIQINNQAARTKQLSQSRLSLSKYASFRKSNKSSWMEISQFGHRHSLRRLSEIEIGEDMEFILNGSNTKFHSPFNKQSISKDFSGDETVSSDDSELTYTTDANFAKNTSTKEVQVTSDSLETQLKVRIDYKLPESRYESSYLSVLTSHTSYWSSPELCMFMLTHIFGHLGEIGNPR